VLLVILWFVKSEVSLYQYQPDIKTVVSFGKTSEYQSVCFVYMC